MENSKVCSLCVLRHIKMRHILLKYLPIFSKIPFSGSPEAEAGVSGVRQAVFRPEAAHPAGARGTQGQQRVSDSISS